MRRTVAVAAMLLALLLTLLVLGARQDSGVVDEHPHLLSGNLYWQTGTFAGGFDNPPLGQLWITAPFQLLQIDYRFPDDTQVLYGRVPVIVLTLLLAALLAMWAHQLGGVWLATAVVGLFCLEPNLLAHGHLATLDAPLAFAWWVALWMTRQWLAGNPHAVWGVCLALAVAVLIKFTALLLFPVVLFVAVLQQRSWRSLVRSLAVCAAALLLTWGLAWLAYGFDGQQFGWPRGFAEAIVGKWEHRNEGHFAYLGGRRSMQGFPEYNLVALALKTPLPLWILSGFGLIGCWRSWQRLDRLLLLVPSLLLLLVFSLGGVHIGVRHLLPLYPGLLLCAAVGLLAALRAVGWKRTVATFLLVWWMASVGRIAPQWIPYFNELAGGPAGGDRWLLDSNLDWGQDDDRLTAFLQREAARGRQWSVNPPAMLASTGGIIVNVNELHGLLRLHDRRYAWLRRHAPQGRVGWSWKIWDLSVENYAQALEDHPQDEELLIDYAKVLAAHGRESEALALLQSHLSRLSSHGWQAAVEIALDAELMSTATDWVERVPAELRGDERWQALLYRLQLQQNLRGDASGRNQLQMGLYWAQMGEFERAEPFLRSAARALPQDVDSQRAWMTWLGQAGRYNEAAAVASQPAVAAALRDEFRVLSSAARTQEDLQRALKSGGRIDPSPLREWAQTEFEAERVDRAAGALVQLLRQDAADRDALHLLGEIQVRSKLRVVAERLAPRSLRAPLGTTEDRRTAP